MRWLTQLGMRLQMLFGRGRAGERLDDELRFHIERQIAENVAAGMSARRSPLRRAAHLRQSCPAARPGACEVELARRRAGGSRCPLRDTHPPPHARASPSSRCW